MTPAAIMRTVGALILANGTLAGVLLGVARMGVDQAVRFWTGMLAAALLVSVAGMLPSWMSGQGRERLAAGTRTGPAGSAKRAGVAEDGSDDHSGWPYALALVIPIAVVLLELAWQRPAESTGGSAGSLLAPAVIALVLVFPLIVVELLLSDIPFALLTERDAVLRLVRIP